MIGVDHLDDPDEYLRMSPITYVKDINTPVLILHSEDDLRCPVEQADQLFVALRLLGKRAWSTTASRREPRAVPLRVARAPGAAGRDHPRVLRPASLKPAGACRRASP